MTSLEGGEGGGSVQSWASLLIVGDVTMGARHSHSKSMSLRLLTAWKIEILDDEAALRFTVYSLFYNVLLVCDSGALYRKRTDIERPIFVHTLRIASVICMSILVSRGQRS